MRRLGSNHPHGSKFSIRVFLSNFKKHGSSFLVSRSRAVTWRFKQTDFELPLESADVSQPVSVTRWGKETYLSGPIALIIDPIIRFFLSFCLHNDHERCIFHWRRGIGHTGQLGLPQYLNLTYVLIMIKEHKDFSAGRMCYTIQALTFSSLNSPSTSSTDQNWAMCNCWYHLCKYLPGQYLRAAHCLFLLILSRRNYTLVETLFLDQLPLSLRTAPFNDRSP